MMLSHDLNLTASGSTSRSARRSRRCRTIISRTPKTEPSRFVIVDAMLSPEIVTKFVADAIRQVCENRKEAKEEVIHFSF